MKKKWVGTGEKIPANLRKIPPTNIHCLKAEKCKVFNMKPGGTYINH